MMYQHTSVSYYSVPSSILRSKLYDMYSYGRDEYDDPQRIRTYIYIYIYIYMNMISMKMVKCNYPK